MVDKAKLWDELKADLERDQDQFYVDRRWMSGSKKVVRTHGDETLSKNAKSMLDRMNQLEILAIR